jgi:hypothetical protein
MIFPAKMKKGIAINTGLSIPVKMRWATKVSGVPPCTIMATRGVRPNTKAIGTPMARKKTNDITKSIIVMVIASLISG